MMMDNNFEKAFGEYLDSAEYDTIANWIVCRYPQCFFGGMDCRRREFAGFRTYLWGIWRKERTLKLNENLQNFVLTNEVAWPIIATNKNLWSRRVTGQFSLIASRGGCKRGNGRSGEWTREGGRTRRACASSSRRETGPVIHPGLHHVCRNRADAAKHQWRVVPQSWFSVLSQEFFLGWDFLFLPEGADTMREKYLPGRRWCPLPEKWTPVT